MRHPGNRKTRVSLQDRLRAAARQGGRALPQPDERDRLPDRERGGLHRPLRRHGLARGEPGPGDEARRPGAHGARPADRQPHDPQGLDPDPTGRRPGDRGRGQPLLGAPGLAHGEHGPQARSRRHRGRRLRAGRAGDPQVRLPGVRRRAVPNGPFKEGPGEINYPITCGGQIVRPGDFIVADDDGVVVMRQELAPSVIEEVHKIIQREDKRLKEIEAGQVIRPGIDEMLAQKGIK